MIFVHGTLALPPHLGSPPVLQSGDIVVPGRAAEDPVTVALTGFEVHFVDEQSHFDDHFFGQIQVQLDHLPGPTPDRITVTATLSLRDWSGEFNDRYTGQIKYVVISGQ